MGQSYAVHICSCIKLHEKIITDLFVNFLPGSSSIFKDIKLLKLRDIHKLFAMVKMFRVLKLNHPTISENMMIRYPDHDYRMRCSNALITPFPKVNQIKIHHEYQYISI